ncbi:chromosome segregation protein SMC [Streptomyces calidiresistens]|uniref:Chromosome partition protein Smc n=1 Tax=Streptomyces calidiresistens TaxID=1485586 RepID=A0A7W3T4H1_9ACTN|nr:chromosome segregation protein SMC [Streptomyces calidiresistens]MBB0230623.1 chromosome segregation protein SMC [Streptomyces calidiresistens]
MHLKSLTLRGFKSFASATTLRFEPGITCVVGPNGSGKSNVVDALSWVMGEQGAKSLRGGKMEDVIFAGTTGRPPLGRAEVSLTIDNSDGALPIDYTEVTITRIMFRNGGSEYQINGDTCRLLDIQELLSDSGIGREMHVIVGQGQLDSVLHADPTGRRAFIEEAAGVLKHRKRKEKALRKLDAMQANLARVQDLTEELRRQLKPLGRQAAAARRAAVIQAELRDARLRLLADELVGQREALRAELADEAALRARREEASRRLADAAHREAALEEQITALAPRLETARRAWHHLSRLDERVRGTVGLAEARVTAARSDEPEERRGRDPEDLEREAARIREQEAELTAAMEAAERALEDTAEHRSSLERAVETEERRLRDANRAAADRREHLARLNGRLTAARGRAEVAAAGIARLVTAREEAEGRAGTAGERHGELRAAVARREAEAEELAGRLEAARAAAEEADGEVAAVTAEHAEAERERAALTARHEALLPSLRRRDGTAALLESERRPPGIPGTVAELLAVEPGYEVAVGAALDSAADALVADGPDTAIEALRLLREGDGGRAVLLLTDPVGAGEERGAPSPDAAPAPIPEGARPVADLLSGPPAVLAAARSLLARTVLVADTALARAVVDRHPDLTTVTPEGDVLSRRLARGGSAGAPGTLEVRAAVEAAAAGLESVTERAAELAERLETARAAREERRAEVAALERATATAERGRSELARELGALDGRAGAAGAEAERAAREVERARAELERAREEEAELAERLAVLEEDAEAAEEPDTAVRDRLAADAANARQTEMEARLHLRTHEERVRALAGRADSLDRAARVEREARARAERRRARRRHEAAVAGAVAAAARMLSDRVAVSLARAEADRRAVEAAGAEREEALAAERRRGRELKEELDRLTDSVHRGEVLGAEKRLRIEQLETRALEELGVEPDALVREYGPDQPVPPPPAAEGEEVPADPDHPRNRPVPFVRAEQEKRLRAAERAHRQLGKVNPLALEEFAALEERHRFLGEQLEDLRRTRADLLQVVKEVDERVEQVFTAAYRDTAREFEGVFGRLFPGGEGRLVLTDPENMLTTGVDVEARPPGKKVKRLSLLSGGERSLTAVALLVSIFKARPSPFYVMDEVEAALDDTNLRRLIGIMAELRESSQLIVITHQKRTMEIADALYGVSMQGDGVSKVIGQRLARSGAGAAG